MLRVLELFAGIGACSKAMERLGIEHEIVDAVEIDKYAIKSFNAVHGTNFEPQDITKWDKDIDVDFIIHGSPCQDFSVAGLGKGGDKGSGTRSSLMYETLRIVEKLKPKYVIWENVKNLLSQKHRHNFDAYIEAMSKLGYVSRYQVLNAKDYGVPQNRERVFTVSILGGGDFEFPPKQELGKKLKDVLEDSVDEKYYLSDEQVASFKASTAKAQAKGNGFKFEPIERERERVVAHTIATRPGSRQTDNFIAESSAESKQSTAMTYSRESMAQMDAPQHSAQWAAETPSQRLSQAEDEGGTTTRSTQGRLNEHDNECTKGQLCSIVDDIYKNRPPRIYRKTAPTIRANHAGDLKVVREHDSNKDSE